MYLGIMWLGIVGLIVHITLCIIGCIYCCIKRKKNENRQSRQNNSNSYTNAVCMQALPKDNESYSLTDLSWPTKDDEFIDLTFTKNLS